MSKSANMLRTRRRDVNIKPNRRFEDSQGSRSRRRDALEKKEKNKRHYLSPTRQLFAFPIPKASRFKSILASREPWQPYTYEKYRKSKTKKRKTSKNDSRLDRKSSRGMLYENEELRLKTININAEIERGQSDIKKLKRENEMLKKEIWCLRDEYEKLDKLLKEKELEFSSSSTSGSSDSESCSSCSEESEEVETSQNLENVQKTNLKNLHVEFDHLSVVPEENSTENSDKASNRVSLPNDPWNSEKDVLKADQSYPAYENTPAKSTTLPVQEKIPKHFFSPIKISKSFEDSVGTQYNPTNSQKFMENYYWNRPQTFQTFKPGFSNHSNPCTSSHGTMVLPNYAYYPEPERQAKKFPELPPLDKASTDLIVKMDNRNFNPTPSQSTFSNGGNLEELLKDIETISHDILEISNAQGRAEPQKGDPFSFCLPRPNDVPNSNRYIPSHNDPENENKSNETLQQKPYKSELNVVLMPTAMPLIGFDKYRQIAKSCESLQKSLENMSASQQDLAILTEDQLRQDNLEENLLMAPVTFGDDTRVPTPIPHACLSPVTKGIQPNEARPKPSNCFTPQDVNPFFFGHPEPKQEPEPPSINVNQPKFPLDRNPTKEKVIKRQKSEKELCNSKSNLLDITSSDHVSSENEENIKLKTSKSNEKLDESQNAKNNSKVDPKKNGEKTPKLSIRRKVSIHFKGKKDKNLPGKTGKGSGETQAEIHKIETPKVESAKADGKHEAVKPKTPGIERKFGIFEKHVDKDKKHQKTPSIDSKKSTAEAHVQEPKTPSSESKSSADKKQQRIESQTSTDSKTDKEKEKSANQDKKGRKSISTSPERKHPHRHEGKRDHKKHRQKGDKSRHRRSTISNDRFHRERSFSVCTDRSNILDHRGYGFSSNYLYDDFSERERTNSLSSNDTVHRRKMSNMSNFPANGKIPWCGCWGNGCL